MIFQDISHPDITDMFERIEEAGLKDVKVGYDFVRLNDFANYAQGVMPDRQYAFFPLKSTQNIGVGNKVLGLGEIGKNVTGNLSSQSTWSSSGFYFDGASDHSINFDFSGAGMRFRKNPSSVFYILKHERVDSEQSVFNYSNINYYFGFDKSEDTFSVYAPAFSNDPRAPIGTTAVYDEVFGLDKRGFSMNFPLNGEEAMENNFPIPCSFHDMGNDWSILALHTNPSSYKLHNVGGKDDSIYSGNFKDSYFVGLGEDFWMNNLPSRIVIGADKLGGRNAIPHRCIAAFVAKGTGLFDYLTDFTDSLLKTVGIGISEAINLKITESAVASVMKNDMTYWGWPVGASGAASSSSSSINFDAFSYIDPDQFYYESGFISSIINSVDYRALAESYLISYDLIGNTGWAVWSPESFDGRVSISSINHIFGFVESGLSAPEAFGGSVSVSSVDYIAGFIESGLLSTEIFSGGVSVSDVNYIFGFVPSGLTSPEAFSGGVSISSINYVNPNAIGTGFYQTDIGTYSASGFMMGYDAFNYIAESGNYSVSGFMMGYDAFNYVAESGSYSVSGFSFTSG
jgi:hypothetical protein